MLTARRESPGRFLQERRKETTMDQETLKLRRLSAQYLLAPASRLHVVRAMDGFQAQFLSNAMHAMRLRSADPDAGYAADGLVKSWTLRGTNAPVCGSGSSAFSARRLPVSQPGLDGPVLLEPAPGLGADAAAAGVFLGSDRRHAHTGTDDARGAQGSLPRRRDDGGGGSIDVPPLGRRDPGAVRARLPLRYSQRGKSLPALPAVRTDG